MTLGPKVYLSRVWRCRRAGQECVSVQWCVWIQCGGRHGRVRARGRCEPRCVCVPRGLGPDRAKPVGRRFRERVTGASAAPGFGVRGSLGASRPAPPPGESRVLRPPNLATRRLSGRTHASAQSGRERGCTGGERWPRDWRSEPAVRPKPSSEPGRPEPGRLESHPGSAAERAGDARRPKVAAMTGRVSAPSPAGDGYGRVCSFPCALHSREVPNQNLRVPASKGCALK